MNKIIVSLKNRMADKQAEVYVDSAVKILIAIVIGALLLTGLIWLFNEVIMPKVNDEVTEMFANGDTNGGFVEPGAGA